MSPGPGSRRFLMNLESSTTAATDTGRRNRDSSGHERWGRKRERLYPFRNVNQATQVEIGGGGEDGRTRLPEGATRSQCYFIITQSQWTENLALLTVN